MKKAVAVFIAIILALSVWISFPVTACAAGSIDSGGSSSSKPKITNIRMPSSIACNASASISFKVNKKCSAGIGIYDANNKLVVKLKAKTVQKNKTATFKWNGKNSSNQFVPAGKYKIKLTAGKTTVNKSLTVNPPVSITDIKIPASIVFKGNASISFKVSQLCSASVQIYDFKGAAVYKFNAKSVQKKKTAVFLWDGKNAQNQYAAPGRYTVKLIAGNTTVTKYIAVTEPIPKITDVAIPDSFDIGQESLKVSFKADQTCSVWFEVFYGNGVSLICSSAKKTLTAGQSASYEWNGAYNGDAAAGPAYYPSGSYQVAIHAGSAAYKKEIQAVCPPEGNIGKLYVQIQKAERVLDDTGSPGIRVYFSVKNNSGSAVNAYARTEAFQNEHALPSVTAETAIPEDSSNWSVKIDPGAAITCASVFRLNDNSPVIFKLWKNNEAMLQKTFILQ